MSRCVRLHGLPEHGPGPPTVRSTFRIAFISIYYHVLVIQTKLQTQAMYFRVINSCKSAKLPTFGSIYSNSANSDLMALLHAVLAINLASLKSINLKTGYLTQREFFLAPASPMQLFAALRYPALCRVRWYFTDNKLQMRERES
jgi:hypothetical protein